MTTPNTVEIEARQDRAEDLIELLRDPVSFNAVDPPMTLDQRKDFANKVERNLPYQIENGEPLGCTGKVEEMRKRQQQDAV